MGKSRIRNKGINPPPVKTPYPGGTSIVDAAERIDGISRRLVGAESETVQAIAKKDKVDVVLNPKQDGLFRNPLGLKRPISEIISEEGPQDDEVEKILLEMEKAGLVQGQPNGEILVTGTREQLEAYGFDPESMLRDQERRTKISKMMEIDNPTPAQIEELAKQYADSGDHLVLVHADDGKGPFMFPTSILEKARQAGEVLRIYTEQEVENFRRGERDETMMIRLVTAYNGNGMEYMSSRKAYEQVKGLATQVQAELDDTDRDISALNARIADIGYNLLRLEQQRSGKEVWSYTELVDMVSPGDRNRGNKIGQQMLDENAIKAYTDRTGKHEYRLNQDYVPGGFLIPFVPEIFKQEFADANRRGR